MKICFRVEIVAVLNLIRSAVYDVHANKNGLYFSCFCEWLCEQRVMMEDFQFILSGFGRHLFLDQTFLSYFHQRTILARAARIKGNAKKQYKFVKVSFNICNTPAQNLNAKQVFMLVNKTTGLKSTHMNSFVQS